jgi:TolA-binding protein
VTEKTMRELEQIGREAREQLGAPSPEWLQTQRRDLRRALALPDRQPRPLGRWALAVSLAAVVAIAIWMLIPKANLPRSSSPEVALATAESERRVPLEDGSSLLLSAQSRARVKTDAGGTRCVVELGTVHFDVAPQKGREFAVVAGDLEVRVIGTHFSVSREASGTVEVAVARGVVRVRTPARSTPIELRAGDRLRSQGNELVLGYQSEPATSAQSAVGGRPPLAAEPALDQGGAHVPAPNDKAGGRDEWSKLYYDRQYSAAVAAARQVGIAQLLEGLSAQSLAELADAARLGGDSTLALRAFDAIERRFPTSRQARDALFLSGRLLASRGDAGQARARLESYLAQNPRDTYSVEAMGRLVELYAAVGDARAKTTARAYLERAPDGPYQRLCNTVLAGP